MCVEQLDGFDIMICSILFVMAAREGESSFFICSAIFDLESLVQRPQCQNGMPDARLARSSLQDQRTPKIAIVQASEFNGSAVLKVL